jgi:hypothetical protein
LACTEDENPATAPAQADRKVRAAMGYRQSNLQPAFSVAGDHGFTVWGYGTTDTLAEVMQPGYMSAGPSILTPGDLIYVRTWPRRDHVNGPEEGEMRLAIVMVAGWERGFVRLRLVQDLGRPDEGPMPAVAGAASRDAGATAAPASKAPGAKAVTAPADLAPPPRSASRLPGRRSKMV